MFVISDFMENYNIKKYFSLTFSNKNVMVDEKKKMKNDLIKKCSFY